MILVSSGTGFLQWDEQTTESTSNILEDFFLMTTDTRMGIPLEKFLYDTDICSAATSSPCQKGLPLRIYAPLPPSRRLPFPLYAVLTASFSNGPLALPLEDADGP